MEKELLIFGSDGALGKGITDYLLNKDFNRSYLFDFEIKVKTERKDISPIEIKDLAKEENVVEALSKVKPSKNKLLFLYSTIGGFSGGKYIWETGDDDLNRMINMNIRTNFLIAKHFSRLVKESAGGSICFTAALSGIQSELKKSAYGITKAAVVHLVNELALEGEKINLAVNAIAPYIIDTPANRKWTPDADFSKWIKPKEIGQLAHNLFSNFNFVSGNTIKLKNRFDIKIT